MGLNQFLEAQNEKEMLLKLKMEMLIGMERLRLHLNQVGPHDKLEVIGRNLHALLHGRDGIVSRIKELK